MKFMQRAGQMPTISTAEKSEKLAALGAAIAGLRKEAVDARKSSGIEDVWMQCEESYLGIDDANRAEFSGAKWSKPTSMGGPITSNSVKTDDTRSTVFVPLTGRYVDGASSKLSEIILPIDDKAFSLEASPIADMVQPVQQNGQLHTQTVQNSAQPQPGQMAPTGQMQPNTSANGPQVTPQGQPGQPPAAPADPQVSIQAKANDAAEKAETRVYDWMSESKYPFEARKIIKDAARMGVGILKGPIPDISTSKAMTQVDGGLALELVRKVVPRVKWVDPWNFYPADGCGEDIHDGDGCFEKDYLSSRKLKELKKQEGYLKDQIDQVLDEGPGKAFLDGVNEKDRKNKNRYEVWYYYGTVSREDLMLTGTIGNAEESDKEEFHAIVTLVNDTVIRATINPLDSGSFPYHVIPWRRRPGHWAGVGVAEQMFIPQRMVNAATRAMLNNAGLSAGPQIIIDELGIVPADNNNRLYPGKIWYKTGDSASTDVRQSFLAVMIPSVEQEMMAIIEYGMKLAEEATSIPLITQGQQGPTSPQTFGQAELQNNNALTWLRDIGYAYDNYITEPLVDAYYEWLLLDPSVPDEEKGDFVIRANGSAAMVERAIQEQTLLSLLQAVANPAFDLDPVKLMQEYLKGKRLDPRKVQLSDEDKAKRDAQQPPPPIQVQVEQLKGQNSLQAIQAKAQADTALAHVEAQNEMQMAQQEITHEQGLMQSGGASPHQAAAMSRIETAKIQAVSRERQEQIKTERDIAYVSREKEIADANANARIQELQLKRDLAVLDYTSKHNLNLEQTKAELAKVSMQESTKRQLAQAEISLNQVEAHKDRELDLHKHHTRLMADQSQIEPAGKAEPGKAFSQ
jgi:hypothetical protein